MRGKGTPYIRRLHDSDKGDSIRTAYAMVILAGGFGVFRKGYPGICMMAGMSKKAIKEKFNRPWNEVKKFFKEN